MSESKWSKGQRKRKGKWAKRLHIAKKIPQEVKAQIFLMYMAIRAVFSGMRCFSLAFDASRIGGQARMLGFISAPDGRGAWLPPQANGTSKLFLCNRLRTRQYKKYKQKSLDV